MLDWAIIKVHYLGPNSKASRQNSEAPKTVRLTNIKTTPSKALTPSFIFALTLCIQSQPQFVKMGKKTKKPGKGKEKTVKKTAKAEEKRARRESKKLSPEDDIDAILVFIFEFLWKLFKNFAISTVCFTGNLLREKWVLKLLCVWSYIGSKFNFGTVMLYV